MAQTPEKQADSPPPAVAILAVYTILGSIVSFAFGRDPSADLPSNTHVELAPVLIVIAGFLVSYSLWDVMGVGISKVQTNYHLKGLYKDMDTKMPEEVYLALRVQSNQVEQMPVFVVGALSCALFVNGTVAAVLASIWVVLRRCYASAYRGGVGVPFEKMGLSKFTVPAYFAANTMLMAAVVQAVRCLVATK